MRTSLTLSRKSGESLVIGDAVVTVTGKGQIKIHIAAPPSVKIRRSELLANVAEGEKGAA